MAKILVIDDDEQIRYLFKRKLESKGHLVLLEDDGEPGLASFKENKPDLILLDIIMPRKEGLEVLREIIELDPKAKVIAISAGGRGRASDYLDYAWRFGAKKVLEKPVDLDSLATIVDEVLNN
ncbi:MAG: response regulator [Chlorobi bacterium]|nr:response regulator [Chlorobiota bacterium]